MILHSLSYLITAGCQGYTFPSCLQMRKLRLRGLNDLSIAHRVLELPTQDASPARSVCLQGFPFHKSSFRLNVASGWCSFWAIYSFQQHKYTKSTVVVKSYSLVSDLPAGSCPTPEQLCTLGRLHESLEASGCPHLQLEVTVNLPPRVVVGIKNQLRTVSNTKHHSVKGSDSCLCLQVSTWRRGLLSEEGLTFLMPFPLLECSQALEASLSLALSLLFGLMSTSQWPSWALSSSGVRLSLPVTLGQPQPVSHTYSLLSVGLCPGPHQRITSTSWALTTSCSNLAFPHLCRWPKVGKETPALPSGAGGEGPSEYLWNEWMDGGPKIFRRWTQSNKLKCKVLQKDLKSNHSPMCWDVKTARVKICDSLGEQLV